MVLDASDGSGNNLATQVADKVTLNPQDFIGKVNPINLAELLFNRINESEAIRIAKENISSYKISELIFDAAKDKLEQAGQWDSSKFVDDVIGAASTYKLAEMLFKASNIGEGEAKTITKERVSSEKLAKHLFDASGLQFDVEQSKTVVSNIVDNFLAVKATEFGRIANRLKHDGRFKREIRGEKGEQGEKGDQGPAGNSPAPSVVDAQLLTDDKKDTLITGVAGNKDLQNAVATNLKDDEIFQSAVKGDSGPQGPQGQDGTSPSVDAVAAQLLTGEKKDTLVTEVAGNQDLQNAVATNLKDDEIFQSAVKGDSGPQGPQGPAGKDGNSPSANAVAVQLMNDQNRPTLVTEVAGNQDLQNAVANNQDLKDAVTDTLKNEGNLGGVDVSKIVDSLKPKFTLQKGEKLSGDIYEAKVILNDKVIATLPKIGYYMLDDQLVMYNYATQEKVVIREDFLCLKVVRLGSGFGNDDYKLTFCNIRGNEFFEYKKYDPEYSRVPDEYKFISLSHAKKEYNPNLSELISHRPLFLIAGELAEQGSDKYEAAVFELTRDGKGKKMATLINEFGYFNQNREFIHCNYHKEPQCRSYTSAEIDEKYHVTDADSEFYLTKYNDIAIHTIPEL